MRYCRYCLYLLSLVAGCAAVMEPPPPEPLEPPDVNPVPGGIGDLRPYFGKQMDADGAENGEFLLATCGCGEWRVLLEDRDGAQRQGAVAYYAPPGRPPGPLTTGSVTMYGQEGELTILGMMNQDAGVLTGDLDVSRLRRHFRADRTENHDLDVAACAKCHVGENPVWPLPEGHIPYVPGETNCLECHEVVIE